MIQGIPYLPISFPTGSVSRKAFDFSSLFNTSIFLQPPNSKKHGANAGVMPWATRFFSPNNILHKFLSWPCNCQLTKQPPCRNKKRVTFNRIYAVKRYTSRLYYIKRQRSLQRIFYTKFYLFSKVLWLLLPASSQRTAFRTSSIRAPTSAKIAGYSTVL